MGFADVDLGVPEDEILFWPPGDVNTDCLENLLLKAHFYGLGEEDGLVFYRHRLVRGCSYLNPQYENVQGRMSVADLRELYETIQGVPFDPDASGRNFGSGAVFVFLYNPNTGASFVCDVGS